MQDESTQVYTNRKNRTDHIFSSDIIEQSIEESSCEENIDKVKEVRFADEFVHQINFYNY